MIPDTKLPYKNKADEKLLTQSALDYFLGDFNGNMDNASLDQFCKLDDYDVISGVKKWATHPDLILSLLCSRFLDRRLYKSRIQAEPLSAEFIQEKQDQAIKQFKIKVADVHYLCFTGIATNTTYLQKEEMINILYKDGTVKDITTA